MENLVELLNQEKYKAVYDFLEKKITKNPYLLEFMHNLEPTKEFSDEDKKIINEMEQINKSKHEWLINMMASGGYSIIRESKEYRELFNRLKDYLSAKHKSKKIDLVENKWTKTTLQHETKELPKAHLSLSFDEEFLKIKAEVHDNHFLDGNRAWRYGDGFYLNFAMPEGKDIEDCVDTERFYNLGFSMEDGKPIGVLVNHNGKYFLRNIEELTPKITIDEKEMVAKYHIKIPFSFLKPFNPLIDEIGGLNIRYTSQDDPNTRTRISLLNDVNDDTEQSTYRRFIPVSFTFTSKKDLKMVGLLDNRLVTNNTIKIDIHIHSSEELVKERIIEISKNGEVLTEISTPTKIPKGKSIITEEFDIKRFNLDIYRVSVKLGDKVWSESFYKFSDSAIKDLDSRIEELKDLESNPLTESSIYTLEYKVQEIKDSISGFHFRENPEDIKTQLEELTQLITTCQKNKSIYNQSGYLLSAFKSPADETLQPYSFSFPAEFDSEKEYHLLVGLHGSGVTEVGFIQFLSKNLAELGATNIITVGPRGRNLSDNYMGQSEQDVVDMLTLVKQMFKIKRTIIFGFSMGGYGCWRMTLKHPELFEAAIIAAGSPYFYGTPEDDMRNFITEPNKIDYLVIHSENDRAVSIKLTDEFIDNLQKNGFSVQYERLTGVDHGNMDIGELVGPWLKKYLD